MGTQVFCCHAAQVDSSVRHVGRDWEAFSAAELYGLQYTVDARYGGVPQMILALRARENVRGRYAIGRSLRTAEGSGGRADSLVPNRVLAMEIWRSDGDGCDERDCLARWVPTYVRLRLRSRVAARGQMRTFP